MWLNPEKTHYPEVTDEPREIAELLKWNEKIFFYDENDKEIELWSKAHFQYIKNTHKWITDDFAWQEVKLDVINTVGNNLDTLDTIKYKAKEVIKKKQKQQFKKLKRMLIMHQ